MIKYARLSVENIPNFLTISRILLIPVFFASFYFVSSFMSVISGSIFFIASLTDFLDGYLARKLEAQSDFGKLLDPIADKMIIATAIVMLIANGKISGAMLIPAVVILCREFLISGVREHSVAYSKSMPVNGYGKVKTVIQMLTIFILIITDSGFIFISGCLLLYVSAILSIISSYKYLKSYYHNMKKNYH